MADLEIRVTPHRGFNSSQGVIFEADLICETDADLLEGLRNQGVTAVKRISIRRNAKQIATKHIILTFDRSTLPESIAGIQKNFSRGPILDCTNCRHFAHVFLRKHDVSNQ